MDKLTILEQHLGAGRIKIGESLSRYTTLRVGGNGEYFFAAQNQDELLKAYQASLAAKIPFTVLGGGTNVLISDAGLPGLVVRNEARGIKIVKKLGSVKNGTIKAQQVLVEVESGTLINQLVRFACDEGLGGLERHLGLPGTVGGALYMNSKWTKPTAYVGDALYRAKIIDNNGQVKIVDQKYFNFAYDQSILQKTHEVVLSATFLLKTEESKKLWESAQKSMEYRKNTQPMGVASAGCTFRNILQSDAFRLATPNHTTSAGFLVDQVGLKDFQIGNAKFSDKHANFILNLGTAKAADVKGLVDEAKKRVSAQFQVEIQPEIVLLGKFG
ncbi:UDP-N-acetylmuramate dehydrogenase [Candidatus Microgenomates bacterium]|nr:MAG: UDP-N-acetylmuramate dehydrogenase [Candidatus Microgenomates bacterium]